MSAHKRLTSVERRRRRLERDRRRHQREAERRLRQKARAVLSKFDADPSGYWAGGDPENKAWELMLSLSMTVPRETPRALPGKSLREILEARFDDISKP